MPTASWHERVDPRQENGNRPRPRHRNTERVIGSLKWRRYRVGLAVVQNIESSFLTPRCACGTTETSVEKPKSFSLARHNSVGPLMHHHPCFILLQPSRATSPRGRETFWLRNVAPFLLLGLYLLTILALKCCARERRQRRPMEKWADYVNSQRSLRDRSMNMKASALLLFCLSNGSYAVKISRRKIVRQQITSDRRRFGDSLGNDVGQ